jgi:hypothetical protein
MPGREFLETTHRRTWLVKSSGRILGPFSFEDVVTLLKTRRISIIDEVREPFSRWNFIREYKQFEETVHELRAEEAKFLDQETEAGVRTKTVKDFDTDVDAEGDDEFTPIPDQLPKIPATPKAMPYKGQPAKRYGAPNVQKPVFSILLLVSCFALFGAGYYYLQTHGFGTTKSLSSEELLKLARTKKNIGAFEVSLDFYQKAEMLMPLDVYSKLQKAILILEATNQTVEARRILEEILPKTSANEPIRKEIQLASALSYLKELNYNRAEQIYQSILFSENSNMEARLNLGLLRLLRSDFVGANKDFVTLQKEGALEPLVYLGRAIANLGLNEAKSNVERLKNSLEDLDRLNSRSSEFRLETLLIEAVLAQKLGQTSEAEGYIARLIEEDPRLTLRHTHNLLVDRQILKWERLTMYCDFLMSRFQENAISKALGSFCSFQKEETDLALQKIEDARTQFADSAYLVGLQSFYLFVTNRIAESQQVAKLGLRSSVLADRVYAMTCIDSKDWGCAEESWTRVLTKRPGDLEALYGLAQVQFSKNSRDRSMDFVRRGLLESANYTPLLELKERMNVP